MQLRIVPAVVILLAAVVATACDVKLGYFTDDRAVAISATQRLRELYNEGDYEGIYDLGSPTLQQQVSREQFVAAVTAGKEKSGRVRSSRLVGSSCFPNEVRLVYHSEFDNGKFTESVLWATPKHDAHLIMYHLSPDHVPTDTTAQKGCPT